MKKHFPLRFSFSLFVSVLGPCFLRIMALACILIAATVHADCDTAKPVVIIHGIMSEKKYMQPFVEELKKQCPDLFVLNLETNSQFTGRLSTLYNIPYQVQQMRKKILEHKELQNGFNLIGHSLGGVVSRGLVEEFNHSPDGYHVNRLITWASPHRGIYGLPVVDNEGWIAGLTDDVIWYPSSFRVLQDHSDVAELWHDPVHQEEYLQYWTYLPKLNNEIAHNKSAQYRANIINLDKLVLFESPRGDQVIRPTGSCSLDFYPNGTHSGPVEDYKSTAEYQKDALGIRSLDNAGRFIRVQVDCGHTEFETDPLVRKITFEYLGVSKDSFPGYPRLDFVSPCGNQSRAEDGVMKDREDISQGQILSQEILRITETIRILQAQKLEWSKSGDGSLKMKIQSKLEGDILRLSHQKEFLERFLRRL